MKSARTNLARLRLRYVKVDGRTAVSKATVFFFSFFPPFSHSVCSDSKVSTRSCSSVEGLFVLRSRDGCFRRKRRPQKTASGKREAGDELQRVPSVDPHSEGSLPAPGLLACAAAVLTETCRALQTGSTTAPSVAQADMSSGSRGKSARGSRRRRPRRHSAPSLPSHLRGEVDANPGRPACCSMCLFKMHCCL